MQQRSAKKITFPRMWTNTCCSHPRHTEQELNPMNYEGIKRAAIRRSAFELGIHEQDLGLDDLHVGSRILYYANGCENFAEYELDYIIFCKKDIPHNSNPDEIMATEYVSLSDLDDFIAERKTKHGEDITPWFRLLTQRSLKAWWKDILETGRFPDEAQEIIRF